jgi:asparagine synthase (glutamine-hydrolysing)
MMLQTLVHRGPDDEGFYVKDRIGIGNRRLSVIDLPGGRQPICNEDETIWIVYNGEIYNYKSLREKLKKKGHNFRTNSDTEVILHLYEELGNRCVDELSGMFAFAIWDEKQDKLFLARDRIGQKPLYYAESNGNFYFASEIKAILAISEEPREIDYESLHHYLSLRFIPPPKTIFRSIKKLPAANVLVWQDGKVTMSRYWHLSFRKKLSLSESELIDGLRNKLDDTIESHLVSDVPVGAFLSGGMDSSVIVAFMAKNFEGRLPTFTIGVKEESFNERPYARMVAERYQTDHRERIVDAEIIGLLPKMIWHLDEPSDPIAACQFYAAELAAQHVKVVLGGDGGDELFAGFDRYAGIGYLDLYTRVPAVIRQKLIGSLLSHIPEGFSYKNVTQKLRWVQQLSMHSNVGERFAEATSFFRFNHQGKQVLFTKELWDKINHLDSADIIVSQFENSDAENMIDKMLYTDFMTRLPEHSLMLTDRMTMAHGVEARSPYLDYELVEFLAAFPNSLKIRGRKLKYVLRKIAREYLPEEIIRRSKQGFMFPVAFWFRDELYSFLKSFLLNSYFVKEGLFKQDTVLRLIEDHRNSRVDNHVRLWMLLNLELWYRIYIEHSDWKTVGENMRSYL